MDPNLYGKKGQMNVYRHPNKPSHIVIQSDRYSDALLGVLGDEDWDPGMQAFVLSSEKYISTRNVLVNKGEDGVEGGTSTQIKNTNKMLVPVQTWSYMIVEVHRQQMMSLK